MEKIDFSIESRKVVLKQCQNTGVDVVIIGGGITGAGCLRDATLRGMRALLIDKNDFASGTSSHSSKLIHGGLRYLEMGDFPLVFQGLQERAVLLKYAPHIVKPQSFLYPIYASHKRGLPLVTLGTYFYHLLSMFKGQMPTPRLRLKNGTLRSEPSLLAQGLKGSIEYYDGITCDTTLTLANITHAWNCGGLACNYAKASDLIEDKGQVLGVTIKDQLTQKTYAVRARWVINTTGPWSDNVRKSLLHSSQKHLRPTKGTHIILNANHPPPRHAILMISPDDQRVMFTIPWMHHTLVGTTDTDYQGDLDRVEVDENDVQYMLRSYNSYFPGKNAKPSDILSSFAGLRPLINHEGANPSSISRDHQILSEKPGFVTMIGGKLTSYRAMSQDVIDWILDHTPEWKHRYNPCQTHKTVLPFDSTLKMDDYERMINEQMAATPDDILYRRTKIHWFKPESEKNIRTQLEKLFKKHDSHT